VLSDGEPTSGITNIDIIVSILFFIYDFIFFFGGRGEREEKEFVVSFLIFLLFILFLFFDI
jgi:hypothetical protein